MDSGVQASFEDLYISWPVSAFVMAGSFQSSVARDPGNNCNIFFCVSGNGNFSTFNRFSSVNEVPVADTT